MSDTQIERILIIRAGAIGDLILTLPAIAAIRQTFPKAYIEIMGYLSILEIVHPPSVTNSSEHPLKDAEASNRTELTPHYADKITSIEIGGLGHFFEPSSIGVKSVLDSREGGETLSLPRNLVDYFSNFDLIVAYWRNASAFRDNLKRIGVKQVIVAEPFPPPDEHQHVSDHLLEALRPLNTSRVEREPRIYLADDYRRFARYYLRKRSIYSSTIRVAVHPGSGGKTKTWLPERFAEVIQWFIEERNAEVLLISGPADEEVTSLVLKNLTEALKERTSVINDVSLVQLAAILEQCHYFVGNDSGVTHIAAAVLVPTLAIFGPTDPNVWGPRGSNVSIVRGDVYCSPCSREDRLACQNRICLNEISVNQVLETLVSMDEHEPFTSIYGHS